MLSGSLTCSSCTSRAVFSLQGSRLPWGWTQTMVKKCKHVKGMWTHLGNAIWCSSSSSPSLLVKACWHFCIEFSRKEQINTKTELQHSQAQAQMRLYHSSENLNQAKLTWCLLSYCFCQSSVNHGDKHTPVLSEMHPGCFNLFIVALGVCLHCTNLFWLQEPGPVQLCQWGFAWDKLSCAATSVWPRSGLDSPAAQV